MKMATTRRDFLKGFGIGVGSLGLFGCSAEEIAITRNVTESMQIALLGLELKPGDEILTTSHDYPSMNNSLYQRENITPKTKIILVCHITNLTGQIFPIKEICQMARDRGIEVVIMDDGTHRNWFSLREKGKNKKNLASFSRC
jgi:selenocysteine lyase/cysteine desulfurase